MFSLQTCFLKIGNVLWKLLEQDFYLLCSTEDIWLLCLRANEPRHKWCLSTSSQKSQVMSSLCRFLEERNIMGWREHPLNKGGSQVFYSYLPYWLCTIEYVLNLLILTLSFGARVARFSLDGCSFNKRRPKRLARKWPTGYMQGRFEDLSVKSWEGNSAWNLHIALVCFLLEATKWLELCFRLIQLLSLPYFHPSTRI